MKCVISEGTQSKRRLNVCSREKHPKCETVGVDAFFFFFISAFGDYKVLTQSGTYIIFI